MERAQENNTEYMELNQLHTKYTEELETNSSERAAVQDSQVNMQTLLKVNMGKRTEKAEEEERYAGYLKSYQIKIYDVYKKSIEA